MPAAGGPRLSLRQRITTWREIGTCGRTCCSHVSAVSPACSPGVGEARRCGAHRSMSRPMAPVRQSRSYSRRNELSRFVPFVSPRRVRRESPQRVETSSNDSHALDRFANAAPDGVSRNRIPLEAPYAPATGPTTATINGRSTNTWISTTTTPHRQQRPLDTKVAGDTPRPAYSPTSAHIARAIGARLIPPTRRLVASRAVARDAGYGARVRSATLRDPPSRCSLANRSRGARRVRHRNRRFGSGASLPQRRSQRVQCRQVRGRVEADVAWTGGFPGDATCIRSAGSRQQTVRDRRLRRVVERDGSGLVTGS
jgi:hypothetical protein